MKILKLQKVKKVTSTYFSYSSHGSKPVPLIRSKDASYMCTPSVSRKKASPHPIDYSLCINRLGGLTRVPLSHTSLTLNLIPSCLHLQEFSLMLLYLFACCTTIIIIKPEISYARSIIASYLDTFIPQ